MFWNNRQRVTPEGWITPDHRTFHDWFVDSDHYKKIKNKPDKMANAMRQFQNMMFSAWLGEIGNNRKESPIKGLVGMGGGAGGLGLGGPGVVPLASQLDNFYMAYPLISNLNVSPFTAPTDAGGATYNPVAPSSDSTLPMSGPGPGTSVIGSHPSTPSLPTALGGPTPAFYYQPDSFPNSYYNNSQYGMRLDYNGNAAAWDLDQDFTIDVVFYLNLSQLGLNSKCINFGDGNQGLYIEALPGPQPKSIRLGASGGGSPNFATSPGNIPQYKTWHYARISKQNGGPWGMSLDGNDFDFGSSNATTNAAQALYIGCYTSNFYQWVGWIGYLRFYNDYRLPVNPADYESVLFG